MGRFDELAGLTESIGLTKDYKYRDAVKAQYERHADGISEHLHQGIGALNSNLKDAKKAKNGNAVRGLSFAKKLLEQAASELDKMRKTTRNL